MAGLARFSEAISSSVSDCRLYSFLMRSATTGSSRSRARKDIVTIGAAITRILSRAGRRRAEELGDRDGPFTQHVGLGTGEVEDARRHSARSLAAIEDRRQAIQCGGLI